MYADGHINGDNLSNYDSINSQGSNNVWYTNWRSSDIHQGTIKQSFLDLSPALFLTSTTFSLLNENAVRNINSLEKDGAYWSKITGKYAKSTAREISNNKFVAEATEGIGKKLFYIGAAQSVYNYVKTPSARTLIRGTADIIVRYAGAFIPGAQIPALIYFGGMFIYDMATSDD